MTHPAIQLLDVRRQINGLTATEKELESEVAELMGDAIEMVIAMGQSVAGYASTVLLVSRQHGDIPNMVTIKKFPLVRGEG